MPSARLRLWTVGGALLATAVTAVILLYGKATEIDRTTPAVAVRQFLGAVFIDQSDARVRLFTCPEWTPDQTAEIRQRFDVQVKVSWQSINERSRVDDRAEVTAKLALLYPGELAPSGEQQWRFDVVEDDGWRVCRAEPI